MRELSVAGRGSVLNPLSCNKSAAPKITQKLAGGGGSGGGGAWGGFSGRRTWRVEHGTRPQALTVTVLKGSQ